MTFRVWESLSSGRTRLVPIVGKRVHDPDMLAQLTEQVAGAPKVVASEAARIYWESPDDLWQMETAFGPLRLPFESMWIEWAIPRRVLADGGWVTASPHSGFASLNRAETDDGLEHIQVMGGFVRDSTAYAVSAVAFVTVDRDGNALPGTDGYRTVAPNEDMAEAIDLIVKPAMLAVSLMNCRNVVVSEAVRTPKRRKNRPPQPSYTYHVIQLPKAVSSMRSARTGMGGGVPVHITRGHFKTYTEDAPLFGKNVGTWWWHDHIKGDPNHGVSAHDYSVQ